MRKTDLKIIFLLIGIFWLILGYIIWSSTIPIMGSGIDLKHILLFIFAVIMPSWIFIILTIIFAIKRRNP